MNCAGRTRSIIGTQSLINAGLPNRVVALRNGTIGWTLAGFDLDRGQARRAPDVSPETARQAEAAAWAVADRAGVRRIDRRRAERRARGRADRLPVRRPRAPEEYESGHRPGFRSAPGGQLVQETDWYAPVRGALIILDDDGGGRAAMTASWLAQMGWDVAVAVDRRRDDAARPAAERGAPAPDVAAGELRPTWPTGCGPDRRRWWTWTPAAGSWPATSPAPPGRCGPTWPRPELLDRLGRPDRLIVTSSDGYLAAWAAADLSARRERRPRVLALAGGTDGWATVGPPAGIRPGEMLSPALDVYRRPYEGTDVDPAVMQAYLDWEYGLVGQLGRDGTHGFCGAHGLSPDRGPGPARPLTDASGRRLGRLTTMASWLLRAMTTTASSAPGFSSRCGTYGGTKM